MPTSLAPFRHRSFLLLWVGAFVSNIGTWMETVALGYYVADTTQQAGATALIAAAGFVPTGLLGPFGGAIADRFPRRRILVTTNLVSAASAATLAVMIAAGEPPVPLIALLVFATGCAGAFGFPAWMSMVPDLVGPDDLVAAIGLGSAQFNLGRIVGPVLAGVVISVAGVPWALAINAGSFFAVIAALAFIHVPGPRHDARDTGIWPSIVAGWRFTLHEPGLRVMLLVMVVVTLVASPFIALLPAFAVKVLDGDEATASALVTAQGIGAVAAALTIGSLAERLGQRRLLVGAVTGLGPALVLYALSPNVAAAVVALVVVGGFYLFSLSSFTSISQTRAPAELRGRALSLNLVALGILYPLGSLVQGRIADTVGLRVVTAVSGLLLLAVLGAGRLLRPGITAPIDIPPVVADR